MAAANPQFVVEPRCPPFLPIPTSTRTVDVRIIDTTTDINFPTSECMLPTIKGHENYNCPSYSFLISHPGNGGPERHLLFDLGVRKDMRNLAPDVVNTAFEWGSVEKDVPQILEESGLNVRANDIEAVIWSHHHWDHIGDMSLFPPSTSLIVGPGFKSALLAGYPADPDSAILETDYADREFTELAFEDDLTIGGFRAHDYFRDGSFYLLAMPGHAPGHLGALARVTTDPDSFILLVGDACDHGGELRLTAYQPLPTTISPSPIQKVSPCPGALFQRFHREYSATTPFYVPAPDFPDDFEAFKEGLGKLELWDAQEHVLVAMAHDMTLKGCVDFFPERANGWLEAGVKERVRWRFLGDFREAVEDLMVGKEGVES